MPAVRSTARVLPAAGWLLLMRADKTGAEKLPRLQEALARKAPLLAGCLLKEMPGLLWAQLSKEKMEEFLREWRLLAAGIGVKGLRPWPRLWPAMPQAF